jgi:hypothetical protein
MTPDQGDCCIFCTYGDVPCIGIQLQAEPQ